MKLKSTIKPIGKKVRLDIRVEGTRKQMEWVENKIFDLFASDKFDSQMKWSEDELQELESYTNTDSNGDPSWEQVAQHLNTEFGNNRTAEACRKRWNRYMQDWREG